MNNVIENKEGTRRDHILVRTGWTHPQNQEMPSLQVFYENNERWFRDYEIPLEMQYLRVISQDQP